MHFFYRNLLRLVLGSEMTRDHELGNFYTKGTGKRSVDGELQVIGTEANRDLTSKLVEFCFTEVGVEIGQYLSGRDSLGQSPAFDQLGVLFPRTIVQRSQAVGGGWLLPPGCGCRRES